MTATQSTTANKQTPGIERRAPSGTGTVLPDTRGLSKEVRILVEAEPHLHGLLKLAGLERLQDIGLRAHANRTHGQFLRA